MTLYYKSLEKHESAYRKMMKQVQYNNELQKLQMKAVKDAESSNLSSAETLIKLSELKKQIKQMNDVAQAEVKTEPQSKRIPQIQYSDINLPSPRSETYTPKPYSPVVESPYSYYSPVKKYTPPSDKQLPADILDQLRVKLNERNSRQNSPNNSTKSSSPTENPEMLTEGQAESPPPSNEKEPKIDIILPNEVSRFFNKTTYIKKGKTELDQESRKEQEDKKNQSTFDKAIKQLESIIIKSGGKETTVPLKISDIVKQTPIRIGEDGKTIEYLGKKGLAKQETWNPINKDKIFKTLQTNSNVWYKI